MELCCTEEWKISTEFFYERQMETPTQRMEVGTWVPETGPGAHAGTHGLFQVDLKCGRNTVKWAASPLLETPGSPTVLGLKGKGKRIRMLSYILHTWHICEWLVFLLGLDSAHLLFLPLHSWQRSHLSASSIIFCLWEPLEMQWLF